MLRHGAKVLQIVWWWGGGGQEQARVGNGQKKMPGALTLPLWSSGTLRGLSLRSPLMRDGVHATAVARRTWRWSSMHMRHRAQ